MAAPALILGSVQGSVQTRNQPLGFHLLLFFVDFFDFFF